MEEQDMPPLLKPTHVSSYLSESSIFHLHGRKKTMNPLCCVMPLYWLILLKLQR